MTKNTEKTPSKDGQQKDPKKEPKLDVEKVKEVTPKKTTERLAPASSTSCGEGGCGAN